MFGGVDQTAVVLIVKFGEMRGFMSLKSFRGILAAGAFAIVMPALSHAEMIIQTIVLAGNPLVMPTGETTWTWSDISTQQFNPAWGTLQAIKFTASAAITTDGHITNDTNPIPTDPSGDIYTMFSSTDLHFKLGTDPNPVVLPLVDVFDGTGPTQNSPALCSAGANAIGMANPTFCNGGTNPTSYIFPTESYSAMGWSTYDVCDNSMNPVMGGIATGCLEAGASVGTNPPATDTNPLDLTPLIGTGNVIYTARALNTSSISGPNLEGGVSSTAILTATIEYDYTTTPEPATMVLMGTALAGIGLLRKRIKS